MVLNKYIKDLLSANYKKKPPHNQRIVMMMEWYFSKNIRKSETDTQYVVLNFSSLVIVAQI
jgi:hypothetical protein